MSSWRWLRTGCARGHSSLPLAFIRRHAALRPGLFGQAPGIALTSSPVRCSPAAARRVRLPVSRLTAPGLRASRRRGEEVVRNAKGWPRAPLAVLGGCGRWGVSVPAGHGEEPDLGGLFRPPNPAPRLKGSPAGSRRQGVFLPKTWVISGHKLLTVNSLQGRISVLLQ